MSVVPIRHKPGSLSVEFPDVSGLQNLKELLVNDNELTALHPSVGGLGALEKLICYRNEITGWIPCSFVVAIRQ